jgi:hypothetical protein
MLLTALGGKILQMRKKNCQKGGSYPRVPVTHIYIYIKLWHVGGFSG